MKRFASFALAMILCLGATAGWAAPARDLAQVDTDVDPGMQMLMDTVLGAAMFTGTSALQENAQPSQAMVEAAFALGLYNLSLPHDGADLMESHPSVSAEEAQTLYGMLFVSGAYALPASAAMSGVSRTAGGLEFDLTQLEEAPQIGAYIYSVLPANGGAQALKIDLYSYYGEQTSDLMDLPEDALTWLCHADVLLQQADSAYSWRIRSFFLSPQYEAGALTQWQSIDNAAYEYSVNVPSNFSLADDTAEHMLWQTADGRAWLRVDVEERWSGIRQILQAWQNTHPGRRINEQPEINQYDSLGETDYQLWVTSEDVEHVYHVTLQFPAERLAEYSLYSEFIRNSLIVWGIANG